MFIDVLVAILVVMAVFKGLSKGLIIAVFSFVAFIVGLAAAMKLSAVVAEYMGSAVNIPGKLLPVLAFLLVFFIVVLLVKLGARIIEKAIQLAMMGWLNRLGGVVFYILIYLFIFSIILFYTEQLHIIKPETVEASVTYPYLRPLAPKIINGIGIIFPFFKNMFAQLLQFFQNMAHKSPEQQYTFRQIIQYSGSI